MMWAWWWHAIGAWQLVDYSQSHEAHDLALAVIFVVIGTGQRVVSKIEKGQK